METIDIESDGKIDEDETYLRHLFRNFFENAAEHGRREVAVTVEDLLTGFYVADDGPGIPADERETVFGAGLYDCFRE